MGLAVEAPPAALILRSPFTSLADIGRLQYPWLPVQGLLLDRCPSIDCIRRLECPLLVIAGERDRIVPIEHSRRLFAAAPEPKRFVRSAGADHNDLELLARPQLLDEVPGFLVAHAGGTRE